MDFPVDLQKYEEAITLIFNASKYVATVTYTGADEYLFKIALESELKVQFREWGLKHQVSPPITNTEVVMAYQYPSTEENGYSPACTHLRADIVVHSTTPLFPSVVIELKAVDKMSVKHRRQVHQYLASIRKQRKENGVPELAMVINFRGLFYKEPTEVSAIMKKRKREDVTTETTEVIIKGAKRLFDKTYKPRQIKISESDVSESVLQFVVGTDLPPSPSSSADIDSDSVDDVVHVMKWWALA